MDRRHIITSYNNYKLNYWAIPKCANTTIKASLIGKKNSNPYKQVKWVHKEWNNPEISFDTALQNGYQNFTCIRHPYERFLSLYKHFGLLEPFPELNVKSNSISIDAFLEFICKDFNDDNTCNYHARQQIYFISDMNKNIMVHNLLNLSDIDLFFGQLGVKTITANKSKKKNLVLTDQQKDIIHARYADDFNILKFEQY